MNDHREIIDSEDQIDMKLKFKWCTKKNNCQLEVYEKWHDIDTIPNTWKTFIKLEESVRENNECKI